MNKIAKFCMLGWMIFSFTGTWSKAEPPTDQATQASLVAGAMRRADSSTASAASNGLSLHVLANMTYRFGVGQGAQSVHLTNGRAVIGSDDYALDRNSITYGVLDDSQQLGAVEVIGYSGGGSGYFYELIAVRDVNGAIINSLPRDLGDRVKINSISIRDKVVTVDMLTQGPSDGMCCPTRKTHLHLRLRGNRFVELQ